MHFSAPLASVIALALAAFGAAAYAPPAVSPTTSPQEVTETQARARRQQEILSALDAIDRRALEAARRAPTADVQAATAEIRAEVARLRQVIERRAAAGQPTRGDDGTRPPPDVGTRPPPDGTRPPPTDPGTRPPPTDPGTRPPPTGGGGATPPPAGPWVDPATLGKLPALTPAPTMPPSGVPQWGTELWKYPAIMDAVWISAEAKGSPVIPCLVQGAHQGALRWTRFLLYGSPGPDGVNRARWGARWFDVRGFELEDFTIQDVPDEHGLYWNTIGGFRISRGLFLGMGSQALQVCGAKPGTARAHETGLGASWQQVVDVHRWDWQELAECAVLECGLPTGGRPSYALSFFGDVPNPVRLTRCLVQTTTAWHNDSSGQACDSYGAAMAHNRLRFELLESGLLYAKGDRDTLQLWAIGDGDPSTVDVLLRGSQVDGRGVDIRVPNPGACQVAIEGCWGSAQVTVSTAPTYLGAPPPTSSQVLYKGPVAQPWTNL